MKLLAIFAHPDDEVMSCGGTLARYADEGHQVSLICATRGEEGEIVNSDIDPNSYPKGPERGLSPLLFSWIIKIQVSQLKLVYRIHKPS